MLSSNISGQQLHIEGGEAGGVELLEAVTKALLGMCTDGEITASTLNLLNASQTTLLAYDILRREVGEGGFIQLIHNGYGPFIFQNPFAKMLRQWGLRELSKLVYAAARLYFLYADELTGDMDDETFMALYESHPDFDELDDTFVENEEAYTEALAAYVETNISDFTTIE